MQIRNRGALLTRTFERWAVICAKGVVLAARAPLFLEALSVGKQIALGFGAVVVLVALVIGVWLLLRRSARPDLQPVKVQPLTPPAPAPLPLSPVSFHPQAIKDAARDFDDGVATVLVPKAPKLPSPFDSLPQPTLTHEGERFGLGYLDEAFGIWYLHQQRPPVELFPRTQEGWAAAWLAFVGMEPRNREKPKAAR